MKTVLSAALIVTILLTPAEVSAQHGGHGGGGHGGGGHRGGGSGGHPAGARGPAMHGPGHGPGHGPVGHPGQFAYHGGYNHFAPYHNGWYHGGWHGGWGPGYGYRPWGWYGGGLGWGIGFGAGLAVGSVAFGSPWGWGYYPYYNPYWVAPAYGVTYINYGQPIAVAAPAPTVTTAQTSNTTFAPTSSTSAPLAANGASSDPNRDKASAIFESARGYFKRGDYQLALAETNKAVALQPNDSLMHEFRGLCLFATKDYQQSAAAVYAVLSMGPGWDLATLQGLYGNPNTYSDQLRTLEAFRNQNAEAPNVHFLLAYHYILAGRNDQAATELRTVVKLEPKDQLSAQLLKSLTSQAADPQVAQTESAPSLDAPTLDAPMPDAPAGDPVDAETLVGNWKANRSDGSAFELKLTQDKKFSWRFTQQDKKQQLNGTYTVANNYLILSASGQNALVGQVSLDADDKLKFKLAGGSPSDPGLTFSR